MDVAALLPALYAVLVGTWFGAGLYRVLITGPTLRDAGSSGLGFARAHSRRHGTGMFFAALAFLSVVFAVASYVAGRVYEDAWSGSGLWRTLSMIAAIVALMRGASVNRIAEQRLLRAVSDVKGAPDARQEAELAALGTTARRVNAMTVAMVGVAVVCLVVGRGFA